MTVVLFSWTAGAGSLIMSFGVQTHATADRKCFTKVCDRNGSASCCLAGGMGAEIYAE
jgi:hypothetical protein